ncbi:MAG: hypothetical protein ACNA7K_04575 [Acholeplasmataceae bacterium]
MSQPKKPKRIEDKTNDKKKMREELKHVFHKADFYEEKIEPGHILYGFNYEHLTDEEVEELFEALELELEDDEIEEILPEEKKKAYIA